MSNFRDEMPVSIRHEGEWAGTYTVIDNDGKLLEGEAEGSPFAVARFHSEPAGLKTKLYFDGSLVSPLGSRPGSWMDARSAPMQDRLS